MGKTISNSRWATGLMVALLAAPMAAQEPFDIVSIRNGPWSDPATWAPLRKPAAGDRVLISPGTKVLYDVVSQDPLNLVQVSGTLAFATDRETRLTVCLLKVQPSQAQTSPTGTEDVHEHASDAAAPEESEAVLEVGSPTGPVARPHTARIVLKYIEGYQAEDTPAIVCRPGARMEFHGSPMNRTWVRLGQEAQKDQEELLLEEPVTGWHTGDEILITSSGHERSGRTYRGSQDLLETERRTITAISQEGRTIQLNAPLRHGHSGSGPYRSEVANLSRTVIVESADPQSVRGHTMYHRGAAGSIGYARFAGLGKESTLGRYPIHFHRVRDTMRGSSVIGAAVVDSRNRWITLHGAEYIVVRDCVGYQSVGHGFFLEDGTETYNVLDRNLGIQAYRGRTMKDQALPFDPNDGAAFWWANGRNTFVRNVSCENDEYGYRFDIQQRSNFNATLPVRQPEGSRTPVDVRTIPIYRFSDNGSHSEGLYSFVFAGTDGVGPDTRHPHVLKNLTAWSTHYALRPQLPTMWIENVAIDHAAYGIYRPWFENHVYIDLRIAETNTEPFNRGLDDESAQHGSITVDGLAFSGSRYGASMPFIQMSDTNLSGLAASHFRNVTAPDPAGESNPDNVKPLANRGGGPRPTPESAMGVPVYLHDWYGPGRSAKIVSTAARDYQADGLTYRRQPPLTGDESAVAEIGGVEFPTLLQPVDDQPPATVITHPQRGTRAQLVDGTLVVEGTTTDNSATRRVIVNGQEAQDLDYNFHRWRIRLTGLKPGPLTLQAHGEDEAGNVEQTPHLLKIHLSPGE